MPITASSMEFSMVIEDMADRNMAINVLSAGLATTVQALGRPGY